MIHNKISTIHSGGHSYILYATETTHLTTEMDTDYLLLDDHQQNV